MSSWTELLKLRQPTDPNYPGDPATVVTIHLDNFGGIVLFIDEGDGEKVIGIPLSDEDRLKIAETLLTKEVW